MNYGRNQLGSATHQKATAAGKTAFGAALPHDEQPPVLEGKQQPLSNVFNKMRTEEGINSYFAAVNSHGGIPLVKLGHPSICGLVQKYSSSVLMRRLASKATWDMTLPTKSELQWSLWLRVRLIWEVAIGLFLLSLFTVGHNH